MFLSGVFEEKFLPYHLRHVYCALEETPFCNVELLRPSWTLMVCAVTYPGILFGGGRGGQQIQLRKENRENGDQGPVAPGQGFWRQL